MTPETMSRGAGRWGTAPLLGLLFVGAVVVAGLILFAAQSQDRIAAEKSIALVRAMIATEALPFFEFVPFDNRIALRSNRLPGELHEDPADRAIIATALMLGAPLVSKDRKIRDYPHVETIW